MSGTHFWPTTLRLCCFGILLGVRAAAQTTPPPPDATVTAAQMQEKLQKLSGELTAAQQRLQDSQKEIQRLQDELSALQAQFPAPAPSSVIATTPPAATPQDTAEKVEILQAQVKQHEQSKVESVSKYPVHLTGLVLFNSFINAGNVDNIDLPSIASPPVAGLSTLTTGATVRQTILGVQVTGPHLFGARSSGEVNMDFYGGIPYSNYGTVAGIIRMRTAALRLDWDRDTVELAFTDPLISPLGSNLVCHCRRALAGVGRQPQDMVAAGQLPAPVRQGHVAAFRMAGRSLGSAHPGLQRRRAVPCFLRRRALRSARL